MYYEYFKVPEEILPIFKGVHLERGAIEIDQHLSPPRANLKFSHIIG